MEKKDLPCSHWQEVWRVVLYLDPSTSLPSSLAIHRMRDALFNKNQLMRRVWTKLEHEPLFEFLDDSPSRASPCTSASAVSCIAIHFLFLSVLSISPSPSPANRSLCEPVTATTGFPWYFSLNSRIVMARTGLGIREIVFS